MNTPFPGGGLTPNLIPNQPLDMPSATEAGDAAASMSPFSEPQDVDSIIAQLKLDRPLKLYIPDRDKYPMWEFRIINSIPQEVADAHNKGFRRVTDPKLTMLFDDLVAGTNKEGKAFRPLLFAREKAVGEHVRKRHRQQLASLYAGMDPRNKDMNGKYTSNVEARDGTKGDFSGAALKIKV